jgi:VanZ family protein
LTAATYHGICMASRWLPVLVWAGVIFALSSIPSLSSGLGTWDTVLRKCAHMTEYAILAVLLLRATSSYTWAFGLAVAYAASDEVHQLFVRGRHGSPVDLAVDAVGALIGLAVVRTKLREWTTGR